MDDGMVRVDEEMEVFVSATTAWGVRVTTRDGMEGFIDNLKIPSWLARGGTSSERNTSARCGS